MGDTTREEQIGDLLLRFEQSIYHPAGGQPDMYINYAKEIEGMITKAQEQLLDELEAKKGIVATSYSGKVITQFTSFIPVEFIEAKRKELKESKQ